MADLSIRFYLNELMPVAIAEQLNHRGIDAITVKDLGLQGKSDGYHLQLANEMQRVLCTMDDDYIQLFIDGKEHWGIVFASRKDRRSIGTWVKFLEWVHNTYAADEMRNHIEYLKVI